MSSEDNTDIDEFVGVSLNGVLLSSGLKNSKVKVDPLFPKVIGSFTNENDGVEFLDQCLISI